MLIFGLFRLDRRNEQLWRGQETRRLTHKAFAVLCCLVEHAGQLMTKEALLEKVWPNTYVSEAALVVCIREIRQALGDRPRAPQYIETVYRRGYRFIASVTRVDERARQGESHLVSHSASETASHYQQMSGLDPMPIVAREVELAQLYQWLDKALKSERQIGLMDGESGIGKTLLGDAIMVLVETSTTLWIGHGQSIDQYGAVKAYLPLLEALGRLGRTSEGGCTVEIRVILNKRR